MILCADIGGTNARVALVENFQVRHLEIYPTSQVRDAVDLLTRFSADSGMSLPGRAALAAAGVVEGDAVKGTNIPWEIDCRRIRKEFGMEACLVLNDFEAAAWGLLAVRPDKLVEIGGSRQPDPLGTRAILGAGTGLGEAVLLYCNGFWQVMRTEGGHASFSPRDELGFALLKYLADRYGHVSFERLLSGQGLVEIYTFIIRNNQVLAGQFSGVSDAEKPSFVARLAAEGDRDALRAVNFFFSMLGEEASNLALKCLPSGGVYLAGGVTQHLMDFLDASSFRQAFEDKGRMKGLLQDIPVFAVMEPLLGILGAAFMLTHNHSHSTASTALPDN